MRKKSLFGGAPPLDGEYGTSVTQKRCDEDSVRAVRRGNSSTNIRQVVSITRVNHSEALGSRLRLFMQSLEKVYSKRVVCA
jgi:hypothetical protein